MDIKIEKKNVDGIEMEYCKFGTGERVLIIIPGLSVQGVKNSAPQIRAVYKPYLEDFTVYVFDRRLNAPPKYTIREMEEDTVTVIKSLGLSDLYIFGASQGGMIALEAAIEHPELVKKVAVASTSSSLAHRDTGVINEWIRLAKNKDTKELYLSFGNNIYPPEVFERYREAFIALSETVTDEELKHFIIMAEGLKDFDITDQLRKIDCPVLVTGDFDDAVLDPDMTLEIAENLDEKEGFELYLYHGFGHAVYDTAPDYLKRVMSFFLK